MKIDVEGSELRVLRGGSRLIKTHKPVIVCEVVDRMLAEQNGSVEELLSFLDALGYKYEWLKGVYTPSILAYHGQGPKVDLKVETTIEPE